MNLNIARKARRMAAVTAVLASLLGATAIMAPTDAGAFNVGPGSATFGGVSGSDITCSATANQVRLSINANVQTGRVGGQWLAYRYWTTDGRSWSQPVWRTHYVAFNDYRTSTLFDTSWPVRDGGNYSAYVEVMWHNGYQWTNLQGHWSQRHQTGIAAITSYHGSCYT